MKKAIMRAITGIAIILMLFAVSGGEMMTALNWITFGVCLAWLTLVGFATWRAEHEK